jgi:hypothetical protein
LLNTKQITKPSSINTVKLTEASGVKQIDVSGIRNGQYICTIEANGEVLKRLRFAITR